MSDLLASLVVSPIDAMRLLRCSRKKLYELLGSGELASYLEGRSRKIPLESIHSLIARRLEASKEFIRGRHPQRGQKAGGGASS